MRWKDAISADGNLRVLRFDIASQPYAKRLNIATDTRRRTMPHAFARSAARRELRGPVRLRHGHSAVTVGQRAPHCIDVGTSRIPRVLDSAGQRQGARTSRRPAPRHHHRRDVLGVGALGGAGSDELCRCRADSTDHDAIRLDGQRSQRGCDGQQRHAADYHRVIVYRDYNHIRRITECWPRWCAGHATTSRANGRCATVWQVRRERSTRRHQSRGHCTTGASRTRRHADYARQFARHGPRDRRERPGRRGIDCTNRAR